MKTVLISYDLGIPSSSEDYEVVKEIIKSFANGYAKPLESLWIIKTDDSISDIRDALAAVTDDNDKILVMNISVHGWASHKLPKNVTERLHTHL